MSAATPNARTAPASLSGYDFFAAIPGTPLCTLAPPYPYGLRAHCVRLSNVTYSAELPAFDGDTVSVQLWGSTAVQVKLDRKHDWISQRGDTIVVPRGLPAHFTNQANGESDIVIFSLPSDIWQNTVELDLGGYDRQIELRPFAGQDPDPLLHGLGWALCRQMRSSTERNQLYLESLVHTLTMHLVLNYAIVRPRCLSNRTGLSPAAMRDICDYVEANLTHELSLAELAAVAQYSPYYLARLFRSATGQSVHQYVTARRLAKAEALLTTTDLSLQQIAHAAGFSDQSHLSNQFRKTYGCAPNTVRKQHRPN